MSRDQGVREVQKSPVNVNGPYLSLYCAVGGQRSEVVTPAYAGQVSGTDVIPRGASEGTEVIGD